MMKRCNDSSRSKMCQACEEGCPRQEGAGQAKCGPHQQEGRGHGDDEASERRVPASSGIRRDREEPLLAAFLPALRATFGFAVSGAGLLMFSLSIVFSLIGLLLYRAAVVTVITSMRRHSQVKTPWRLFFVFCNKRSVEFSV